MIISKSQLLAFVTITSYLLASFYVFFCFTIKLEYHGQELNHYFFNILNTHDHYVYVEYLNDIRDGNDVWGLNNNAGIAFFYYVLMKILNFLDVNILIFSFFVNLFVIAMSYKVFKNILSFKGKENYSWMFFLMTPLIYFSQLINKDSFTILLLLISVLFALRNNVLYQIAILPIMFLVRLQLGVFGCFICLLMIMKYSYTALFIIYIITSIIGGLVAKYNLVITLESMGGGFSSFVYSFNSEYILGNFFFNPIRMVQFPLSLIHSFDFIQDGRVDFSRFKNLPYFIILIIMSMKWLRGLKIGIKYMNTAERSICFSLFTFCLVWLMNPTINDRYVILVTPLLLILAIYQFKRK